MQWNHLVASIFLGWVVLGCAGLSPAALTEGERPPAGENLILVPALDPGQGSPVIDGTMTAGEWDQAWQGVFADGSELFLLQAGSALYLAIRSSTPDMIVGNVHLLRGEEISILHTSAALGTAVFRQGETGWDLVKDFAWCCRGTSLSEAALAEREAFLEAEGWTGVNSRVGTPNELEYRIEMAEEQLQIAVAILRATEPDLKIPWPADLVDDVIRLTPGGLPGRMDFTPEEWVTIK